MTKLYKKILFALVGFSLSTLYAQTTVPAIISANQTWTAAGSPYLITQNTWIKPGVTLDIEPGVKVKSNGVHRVIVDGTVLADGTFDSVIMMDSMNFEFTKTSGGYNFNTNSGSTFNYCWFKGRGWGGDNTFKLNGVSMLISNCKFTNTYYTVYQINGSNDTTLVRIVRSNFESTNGSGYPTYISGIYAHLEMDECFVKNMCGIYVPANFSMTRSTVIGQACYSAIRLSNGNRFYRGHTFVRCNSFKNFKGGVFEAFYLDSFNTIDLTNNTFDSADFFLSLYAGDINNSSNLIMNKNNFLHSRQYDVKFAASSSAGTYKIYDLQDNYWGSTDTNDIKNDIYDFNDDITIKALIDYSNYRTSANYICSEEFTGVAQNKLTHVNLYPNPANAVLNIDFEEAAERVVRIYNMMGQLVYEFNASEAHVEMSIAELNNGTYAVMVISNGKTSMAGKVVVAH